MQVRALGLGGTAGEVSAIDSLFDKIDADASDNIDMVELGAALRELKARAAAYAEAEAYLTEHRARCAALAAKAREAADATGKYHEAVGMCAELRQGEGGVFWRLGTLLLEKLPTAVDDAGKAAVDASELIVNLVTSGGATAGARLALTVGGDGYVVAALSVGIVLTWKQCAHAHAHPRTHAYATPMHTRTHPPPFTRATGDAPHCPSAAARRAAALPCCTPAFLPACLPSPRAGWRPSLPNSGWRRRTRSWRKCTDASSVAADSRRLRRQTWPRVSRRWRWTRRCKSWRRRWRALLRRLSS